MADIRHLGGLPLRVRGEEPHKRAERNLADRFLRAQGKGIFTREQLQELDSLGDAGGAPQPAAAEKLLDEIRALGRLPRRVRGTSEAQLTERNLADRMIRANTSVTYIYSSTYISSHMYADFKGAHGKLNISY